MVPKGFGNDCTIVLQHVDDMIFRAGPGIFLLRNTVSALYMKLVIEPSTRDQNNGVSIVSCMSYKRAYDDQLDGDNFALGFVE
jgi:hypothetical protein